MSNNEFDSSYLPRSVIAVPPLARDASGEVSASENAKIIRFLEDGGIRSLLYGGNAVFYHIRPSEFARTLADLQDACVSETTIIPSVGPAYGIAADQIDVLKDFPFATAMLLPSQEVVDQAGIASGVRRLAERYGKPLVLYLKFDRWLEPDLVRSLHDDGVISWIKYAVVLDDPSDDDYLRQIGDVFPSDRIVSGIGEQPAIVHMRDFGVTSFTSGCVCVAPARSMEMLSAIRSGDFDTAERIRQWFLPLEDLRNAYSPIRVLHHAVTEAGIADTGDLSPLLSNLDEPILAKIRGALATMELK